MEDARAEQAEQAGEVDGGVPVAEVDERPYDLASEAVEALAMGVVWLVAVGCFVFLCDLDQLPRLGTLDLNVATLPTAFEWPRLTGALLVLMVTLFAPLLAGPALLRAGAGWNLQRLQRAAIQRWKALLKGRPGALDPVLRDREVPHLVVPVEARSPSQAWLWAGVYIALSLQLILGGFLALILSLSDTDWLQYPAAMTLAVVPALLAVQLMVSRRWWNPIFGALFFLGMTWVVVGAATPSLLAVVAGSPVVLVATLVFLLVVLARVLSLSGDQALLVSDHGVRLIEVRRGRPVEVEAPRPLDRVTQRALFDGCRWTLAGGHEEPLEVDVFALDPQALAEAVREAGGGEVRLVRDRTVPTWLSEVVEAPGAAALVGMVLLIQAVGLGDLVALGLDTAVRTIPAAQAMTDVGMASAEVAVDRLAAVREAGRVPLESAVTAEAVLAVELQRWDHALARAEELRARATGTWARSIGFDYFDSSSGPRWLDAWARTYAARRGRPPAGWEPRDPDRRRDFRALAAWLFTALDHGGGYWTRRGAATWVGAMRRLVHGQPGEAGPRVLLALAHLLPWDKLRDELGFPEPSPDQEPEDQLVALAHAVRRRLRRVKAAEKLLAPLASDPHWEPLARALRWVLPEDLRPGLLQVLALGRLPDGESSLRTALREARGRAPMREVVAKDWPELVQLVLHPPGEAGTVLARFPALAVAAAEGQAGTWKQLGRLDRAALEARFRPLYDAEGVAERAASRAPAPPMKAREASRRAP